MKNLYLALITGIFLLVAGCATSTSGDAQLSAGGAEIHSSPTEQEIASLFDRWNQSLLTGDPQQVVANYAEDSILLPTVSGQVRLTPAEKLDYFQHFLEDGPSGEITLRRIDRGGDMAVDSGYYTFFFARTGNRVAARYSFTYQWDGRQWLIVSHHSSLMPGN